MQPISKQAIEKKLNLLDDQTYDNAVTYNGAVTYAGAVTMNNAVVNMPNLPTSNPLVAGQLWSNAGVVTVSAG